MRLITWIGDIYTKHGYIAALITIVTLVALAAGLDWAFDIDLLDLVRWIDTLT